MKGESQKKVTIGAKLFGFIKNINIKLTKSNSALLIRTETDETCKAKVEMERAKATYCKLRTTTN
ncbi:MAG: hypothetical protein QHH18_01365 [Candidatus Bathyarchaeota archaeon]|nr:hypothetical protein [Candidatus Bathyarchaeota archaeon A05DMB-5]MDH7557240.1 hypothetical protein [Candidatus Bathyarchaeota archaeon]